MVKAVTKVKDEIPESKILHAIWYLKEGKTKKFVCEYLGITYNTKKLENIIETYKAKEEREKELREKAKVTPLSESAIKDIIQSYTNGEAQSVIAKRYYVSPQRIKNVLLTNSVPIRARKKSDPAKTEHIIQDLDKKLKVGEKVFYSLGNCFAHIKQVYDEDLIEYLKSGRQRYVETYPWNPLKSKYSEPAEGIHYEIYLDYPDGEYKKLNSVIRLINNIEKQLITYGREYYLAYTEGDNAQFVYAIRETLFPIEVK